MNNIEKKIILISPDELKSNLSYFFQRIKNVEVSAVYIKEKAHRYIFIIDDHLADLKILPRIQTKKVINPACMPEVRGFIDVLYLNNLNVSKILTLYLSNTYGFNLINFCAENSKSIYSFKIQEYLNIGYFIDAIVIEAYRNRFNFEQVRSYLNSAIPFFLKLVEKYKNPSPLNISYSCSNDFFAIKIESNAFNFKMDTNSPLAQLSDETHFFDASYFHKRKMLQLSSAWFKDEQNKHFKSYFFTETFSKTQSMRNSVFVNPLDEKERMAHYTPSTSFNNELNSERKFNKNSDATLEEFTRLLKNKKTEDLSIIKPRNEMTDEEYGAWQTKALGLSDQLQNEIEKIRGAGSTVSEDDLIKIVTGELDCEIDNARFFVQNLLSEANHNIQNGSEGITGQGLLEQGDDFLKAISNKNLQHSINFLESIGISNDLDASSKTELELQVSLMEKNLEQVRVNTEQLNAGAEDKNNLQNSILDEINQLKQALVKTLEIIKNKEQISDKLKSDFQNILDIKNETIEMMNDQIEELRVNLYHGSELTGEEKNNTLFSENKSLHSSLQLANQRLATMSENMDKQQSDISLKKEKEISVLSTNLKMALALIEKFKKERSLSEKSIEKKLIDEHDKQSSKTNDEKNEQEKQVMVLAAEKSNLEKKTLEDKLKIQSGEIKKLDYKLKLVSSQLEDYQKKMPVPGQVPAKTNDAHTKQLENASARVAAVTADLLIKKKESIKLKQENIILLTKIAELEKKLAA